MRGQQWILIDKLKRNLYIKYELKRVIIKSIIKTNTISNTYKYYALYEKTKLKRWTTINQQTNRCFKTGRQWYVHKLTRYCRFSFRTEAYNGHLPGFKRASW